MKLIVAKNYDEMSAEAAKIMADVIKNKPDCVLGLATGSTPVGMYACLVDMYNKGELEDHIPTDEELQAGFDTIPHIPGLQ